MFMRIAGFQDIYKCVLPYFVRRSGRLGRLRRVILRQKRSYCFHRQHLQKQRCLEIQSRKRPQRDATTRGCEWCGWTQRQETERFCVELLVYSRYAVDEVCRRETDEYPKQELRDLLDLLVARARMVIVGMDALPYADALGDIGRSLAEEAGRGEE